MNKRIKVATVCLLAIVMALLVIACNGKIVENITAQDVSAVYNGQSHSITVTGVQTGDTLTFSTTKEGTYTQTNPSFTDAGEYSVYFKVEREGYTPFEGSATVTITPAVITVTPNALSKIEGEQDPVLTYTSEGNVTGETPAYSGALARAEGEDVGQYLIGIGTLELADASGFKASNYTLKFSTESVKFTVSPIALDVNLSEAVIVLDFDTCVYNGVGQVPAIVSVTLDEDELDEDNYTIAYSNNINVGTATVTITGKDGYTGEASATFAITKATLAVTPDALNKVEGEDDPDELTFAYSGNIAGQTPAFTGALERVEGETIGSYLISIGTLVLADNEDFKAANYTLVLEEVSFEILDNFDITGAVVSVAGSCVYNGQDWNPSITSVMLRGSALTQDDYTVSYSNNKNAGTATVTITGAGDYFGTASANFNIAKAVLTVTPNELDKIESQDDPVFTYLYSGNVTGETPAFIGLLSREPGESAGEYAILIGTLALADSGAFLADNYTLELADIDFVINDKISIDDAEVTLTNYSFSYTGVAITPIIDEVTLNEESFGSDFYTVSYSNNLNAGTATVTVTGKGIYKGSASVDFTISPLTLTVVPDASSKIESQADPVFTYTCYGNLTGQSPGFDGALSREPGESAGQYAILIGTLTLEDNDAFLASNYTLALEEINFVINEKIDIEDAEITLVNDEFDYKGADILPEISKVELDEAELASAAYTVSYQNNKNAGTGTVTITGKGIYTGTASVDFTISPKDLTVTPDSNGKTEGDSDPLLTYTFSGNVAGETPTFTGALSREAGEIAGEYEILLGSLVLEDYGTFKTDNYNLVLTKVYFVIEQFEVNIENGMAYWWLGDDDVESNVIVNTLDGDKVEYSKDGATWTEDQSEITFDTAGVYLVYIKVSRDDVQVAYKAAFMVVEEAIMLADFEDEQMPSILMEARNGGVWSSSSSMEIVEYNGSLMVSYPYSYASNGMNGIIFDMYGNIPAGASYLAMDIYTANILKYNFQHYVYTSGKGSNRNWFTGPSATEQMATTVYLSLAEVTSSYILFSMQINIGSGYSGTIYYDNIRFVKEIPVIPSLEVEPAMVTPANNSVQYEKEMLFVWQENEFASSYDLYIYNDEAGEQLIVSYLGLTDNSQLVDLSEALTVSQKVYWKLVATSILDEEFVKTGFYNYSDYYYPAFSAINFQADDLSGVSWRSNKDGSAWNDMLVTDLVEVADGITAYKTGTTSGSSLFGVRQMFTKGSMATGVYDTIAFTLSTDFPGNYLYRVWIYNDTGGNSELTPGAGVSIVIGESATTFYRKLTFTSAVTKENMVGYAVQLMGNTTPVYFHYMSIVDMSYKGVSYIEVAGQDFVLNKSSAELNGTLSWDAVDALTGEYYVQLWLVQMGQTIWFVGGDTVYESELGVVEKDMSDYSGYFNYISSGNYECNYVIIAKNALCDAGATTFEGTVSIYLTVT